ncbi:MAG: hypothetical protein KC635_29535, partial [Myxococcales bacterium]|nr:hypothetical protein [Myxococcales bacterium]
MKTLTTRRAPSSRLAAIAAAVVLPLLGCGGDAAGGGATGEDDARADVGGLGDADGGGDAVV